MRENEECFSQAFNQASTLVQNVIHETARSKYDHLLHRIELDHYSFIEDRTEKSNLRGDPGPGFGFDAITGSIAGSVSVQANVGRYGHVQGAPNSEQRLAQCRSLDRLNYPLMKGQASTMCCISSTNTYNDHHQGQDNRSSITLTIPIPQEDITGGTLYEPLQLVYYDWQFLQQSRDIVFPVFARTVEYAGRVLRVPIIEELELPEEDQFTHFRLGNLYLRQMWIQNGLQPFAVCTAPENTPPTQPRIATTFQEITGNQQRGIETLVWEHLLNNAKYQGTNDCVQATGVGSSSHLHKSLKQWATIQSTRSSYRDANNQQIFYRNWTIEDIHD